MILIGKPEKAMSMDAAGPVDIQHCRDNAVQIRHAPFTKTNETDGLMTILCHFGFNVKTLFINIKHVNTWKKRQNSKEIVALR
jgi:hypothetical protein